MTSAELEHFNHQQDEVEVNPFMLFMLLLIMPYVLFFGLLMLITWQFNLALLYESVVQVSGTVYIKAWVIGSFVLAFLGALLLSGYRTKSYLSEQLLAAKPQQLTRQSAAPKGHYTIEELPQEEGAVEARHSQLERVIDEENSHTVSK